MRRTQKKRKVPTKSDDKNQSKAFIEKAREIGADETHSAADVLLRQLTERPPQPRSKSADDD